MKRKVAIIVVATVVVITTLVVVFSGGSPAADAAEEFLAGVAAGRASELYDSTDLTLQARMDRDKFLRTVKDQNLTLYQSVDWTKEDVVEEEAELVGTMTLKDGSTAPVKLGLRETEGEWRVSNLHPKADPRSEMGFQQVEQEIPLLAEPEPADRTKAPSKAGLRYLSTETILKLNKAIQSQDYGDFYNNYIAREYKAQIDENHLKTIFQAFYDNKIDLSDVVNFAPIFDNRPEVDANGYFVFEGRYPTYPMTIFHIVYVFEDGKWKVSYLRVMR